MQQIVDGIGTLQTVLAGSKKIFLVCGHSFSSLSIKNYFENVHIPYVKFDSFTPNPSYDEVCNGVDVFNAENCDTIVAIGGGSCMDVAKCIKLFCRMSKDKPYLEQEYSDTGIPLIAIPTTAGSGSESTRFAVIYYEGKKQSVMHESIIPNVAILEPSVLKPLPLYQKKCTLMDALCQGIEAWWSVNSTDGSKRLSKQAVETIMHWWREYIFENSDESAKHIMQAANLAGQAICITQTTAAHAFSYKITSMYNIPHGYAVAVCLPKIWRYMAANLNKCVDTRGENYVEQIFTDIAAAMGFENVPAAIDGFEHILTEMDLVNPTSDTCRRSAEIEVLSTSVNPIRLKNNPIELDNDAIRSLYEQIIL